MRNDLRAEPDADIAAGRVREFACMEAAIAALREAARGAAGKFGGVFRMLISTHKRAHRSARTISLVTPLLRRKSSMPAADNISRSPRNPYANTVIETTVVYVHR